MTTYYVEPGDGAGAIQSALDGAGSGDTVYLANGTYNPTEHTYNFISIGNDGVTLEGQSRAGVIIQAGAAKDCIVIDADGCRVKSLTTHHTVSNTKTGIGTNGHTEATIEDALVYGAGFGGIVIFNTPDSLVKGCWCYENGSGLSTHHNMYVNELSHRTIVEECYLHNCYGSSTLHINGDTGNILDGVIVRKNVIVNRSDITHKSTIGISLQNSKLAEIYNNIFIGHSFNDIRVSSDTDPPGGETGATEHTIHNNLIVNALNHSIAFCYGAGIGARNCVAWNNIILVPTGRSAVYYEGGNNATYPNHDHTNYTGLPALVSQICANPLTTFTTYAEWVAGYRVKQDAPPGIRDAGLAQSIYQFPAAGTYPSAPTTDIEGRARPR